MKPTFTEDLSDKFFYDVKLLAQKHGCAPLDLLGVMMSESGVKSSARCPHSSATGLIGFMGCNGNYYGHTRDEFAALTAEDQLQYVDAYLRPYQGKLSNVAAIYLAVFMPADIPLAANETNTIVEKDARRGWAYAANCYLDFDKNHIIMVGELKQSVFKQCSGNRWNEIVTRVTGSQPNERIYSPWSTGYIQTVLMKLGFNPGAVDGVLGDKTKSALKMFQIANRLVPDGIPGPLTRDALSKACSLFGIN